MQPFPTLPDWVALEHSVAEILTQQEIHGWYFNERSAWELESSLRKELETLSELLRNRHPFIAGAEFTPKRDNRTQGYIKGAKFTRIKELNPTSRDHITWILTTQYGWTPSLTSLKNKKPVIDETVLKDIGTDIALHFLRCLELKKALGMISEGVNAWLKLCTTSSRIHHHCSVATNTFRCAHRKPNLGQVPAAKEYRELFTASPNMIMCGADLAGIELRMLAHYLARYDKGRYADILLNGDIHQVNADAIGISRRAVKTVTYAFLYGAGDEKIGFSVDKQLSSDKARVRGKQVRASFIKAIPGLSELLSAVKKRSSTGSILAIDGRTIIVDSQHKALNYLLQCSAGVIAKRWMLIAHEMIKEVGIEAHQLAFVHDELQFECKPTYVNDLNFTLENSAIRAGEYYNMRIPIAAESKSGNNWSEVH
tara:strand:- start:2343 stop:3617 length:1275 start_codon:yes stop_codon:yes gene_type:complete